MNKKLLFIYNPYSGKGEINKNLQEIENIFKDSGYDPIFYATNSAGDATIKVRNESVGYDRVVVSGGDGTLKEACEGYITGNHRMPLGYIPSGSLNDFAASVGIPRNIIEAAKISVGHKIESLDMGHFGSNFFAYIAAFGLFTEVAYETNQALKNSLGKAAYVLSAGKSILNIPAYSIKVEADDQVIEDQFIYGMVSNSRTVGGMGFLVRGDVDLSDGLFEIMLVRYPNNPLELMEAITYLTRMRNKSDLVYQLQAGNIKISSRENVPWTLDGEFGGNLKEVEIISLKQIVNLVTGK